MARLVNPQSLVTSERGLAGKRWVMRKIRQALGSVSIKGDGVDVAEGSGGEIYLRAKGGAGAADGMFVVSLGEQGRLRVAGGTALAIGADQVAVAFVLPDVEIPFSGGSGWVVLRTVWDPVSGAVLPTTIKVAGSAEMKADYSRAYGNRPGSEGPTDIPLAYVLQTRQITQVARGGLVVRLIGNSVHWTRVQ